MHFTPTNIPDLLKIEPAVHGDARGYFMETWRENVFAEHGIPPFVQDNQSGSTKGVLRGLHYQVRQPQGKLVRVLVGEIFDVAVDLRKSSPTFGQWVGETLSAENRTMLWVPPGFAHGFLVLSETAEIAYRCTDYYAPELERTLAWDDPQIAIAWPLEEVKKPALSAKDAQGQALVDAETYP
ncbi:MAG: dTDP-4-dehydrorhamnose 3,5-epimerase [Gammaproteobacteria bacterium]|nr:MAG: dTDP-4-dehydrorhamnose 3,5-epimerase [Gammaproteobacteria bacterium]